MGWRMEMLLENKVAEIYGGGGAIGGAVALAFADEGAKVFLAGRTLATRSTSRRSSGTPTPWRRRRAASTSR